MDWHDDRESPAGAAPAVAESVSGMDPPLPAAAGDTRRGFLCDSARKLGYAAPIVLLFRPQQACASGGTHITRPP